MEIGDDYLDFVLSRALSDYQVEWGNPPSPEHVVKMRESILRNYDMFEFKTARIVEFIQLMVLWGIEVTEQMFLQGRPFADQRVY